MAHSQVRISVWVLIADVVRLHCRHTALAEAIQQLMWCECKRYYLQIR